MRGVMRARMSDPFAAADHGCATDAELLYLMQQPLADGPMAVPLVLFGVERQLESVHDALRACNDTRMPGPRFILVQARAQGGNGCRASRDPAHRAIRI